MNTETALIVQLVFRFVSFCDIFVALLGACSLWRIQSKIPLAKYTMILLGAIGIEQVCQQIAQLHRPTVSGYTAWFIIWMLCGRFLRIFAVLGMVAYIIGIRRHGKDY